MRKKVVKSDATHLTTVFVTEVWSHVKDYLY